MNLPTKSAITKMMRSSIIEKRGAHTASEKRPVPEQEKSIFSFSNVVMPIPEMTLTRALKRYLSVLVFILIPFALFAQDFPSEPRGMVSDFANVFSSAEQQRLETKLRNYRDSTTNVIAVATLPDLKGYDIQQVGTQLFNEWRMWHEERYNGLLLLIAPNERKIRIEVGYGLEGAVTDAMSSRIIRQVITPEFRNGNFYTGIDKATSIMIDLAEGEFEGSLPESGSSGEDDFVSTIIFILFIVYVIYSIFRRGGGGRGRRRRTLGSGGFIWVGGGSSGGFSGGGGGGFGGFSGGGGFGSGGGGASGGW